MNFAQPFTELDISPKFNENNSKGKEDKEGT